MNEILFFAQVTLVALFCIGALKLGKSALYASVVLNAIMANLFVLKQINLFGFVVTASDAFAIGSLLSLNLLQEHFGKEEAKQATWVCFFMMSFFAALSFLHLSYLPSGEDYANSSYVLILSQAPRLLFASIGVFFLIQQVDRRLFSFFQERFPNMGFSLRSGFSLCISQFLDTVLFSFIGLFGLVAEIYDVILISFLLKMVAVFGSGVALRWVKI